MKAGDQRPPTPDPEAAFDTEEKTPVTDPLEGHGPDRPRETYNRIAAIKAANRILELEQKLAEEQRAHSLTARHRDELRRRNGELAAAVVRLKLKLRSLGHVVE